MNDQAANNDIWQVKIELLRVQTFLFAVPRLRNMIGANVLLGEAVRRKLVERAKDATGIAKASSHPVVAGAVECFPEGFDGGEDPLANSSDPDDPRALFREGILTRDGGHFSALFHSRENAGAFRGQAEALLRKELPGLRFEINVEKLGREGSPRVEARAAALIDLPVFEVCRESGNAPAEDRTRKDDIPVSLAVLGSKKKGAQFFKEGSTQDIIGLLGHKLPLLAGNGHPAPTDLNELCGDDDLAVIHADGNRVGMRYKAWSDRFDTAEGIESKGGKLTKNGGPIDDGLRLKHEGHGERFFHRMRCAVRRAVLNALEQTFNPEDYKGKTIPYQLLMLGGDDLLLVCRASYALDFVRAYARKLHQIDWDPDMGPLTIGAGVAIGHPNVPFHRLQALAEELASSAKRLHRGMFNAEEKEASVVDWLVFSESWAEDPIEQRRREAFIRYQANTGGVDLALTGRPYPILKDSCGNSLEALLDGVKKLEGAARSQLRGLLDELPGGRHWAELCWWEMPDETRDRLGEAVKTAIGKNDVSGPWQEAGGRWKTVVADLVELYELKRSRN